MARTSRLYRKLAAAGIPTPLTSAALTAGPTYGDTRIRSITINRGGTGPLSGIPGNSLEVETTGYTSSLIGEALTLRLSTATAAALAARTGANATAITTRFRGRAAGFRVRDTGRSQETTTISASSWSSILPGHSARWTFPSQTYVTDLLQQILNPPSWGSFIPASERRGALEDYGRTRDYLTDKSFTDLIGDYADKLDILIRDKLDGRMEIMGPVHRRSTALARLDSHLPLTRGQVLAPAEWTQDAWENRRNYYVLVSTDMNGGTTGLNFGNLSETYRTDELIDLTHVIYVNNAHWQMLGAARQQREYTGAYRLPSVDIDLLHLITSPNRADQLVAGQLLELEPGDPIFLSGDWPTILRGIAFADGIKESITPDGWKISLSLTPYTHVIGEPAPIPKPRVWASATGTWDAETRTWDAA